MSKGEETKNAILERAASIASKVGLDGLSIGMLAEDLSMSKSGLFAHFKSKEMLQMAVLAHAADVFAEAVLRPSLQAPRGVRRVRALFENWMTWPKKSGMEGGCFFVAAAVELDDREGPVRDMLVQQQRDWLEVIANVARTAINEGEFKKNLDPDQFAFELFGITLAYHYGSRLLRDAKADKRAHAAFEELLRASSK